MAKSRVIGELEKRPCLFCGKEMKRGYDDNHPFLYCDCPDMQQHDEICEQIEKLRRQLPEKKFRVVQKDHLEPIK